MQIAVYIHHHEAWMKYDLINRAIWYKLWQLRISRYVVLLKFANFDIFNYHSEFYNKIVSVHLT